ncbi:hypothetical protein B296_00050006 [Ensete ventricosum]|uniref:Uncharacterized protein n=1 Tax=Ensete ventricosum TaxID=4639 RepID=A0A426YN47_ENSVE|nr:hypothetical protein B296_00050006 [Ensete ventricosum]
MTASITACPRRPFFPVGFLLLASRPVSLPGKVEHCLLSVVNFDSRNPGLSPFRSGLLVLTSHHPFYERCRQPSPLPLLSKPSRPIPRMLLHLGACRAGRLPARLLHLAIEGLQGYIAIWDIRSHQIILWIDSTLPPAMTSSTSVAITSRPSTTTYAIMSLVVPYHRPRRTLPLHLLLPAVSSLAIYTTIIVIVIVTIPCYCCLLLPAPATGQPSAIAASDTTHCSSFVALLATIAFLLLNRSHVAPSSAFISRKQ